MSDVIHDISAPLRARMPTWPGSPGVQVSRHLSLEDGDVANASLLRMDVHCGTHVDAPDHFLGDGRTVDEIAFERLIGPADVVDATHVTKLDERALAELSIPSDCERLLLKTSGRTARWSSAEAFDPAFPGLDESGARWASDRRLKLIGIDYLSIQALSASPETHRILLRAAVAILEGVELGSVAPGRYELVCLPLLIAGAEAAPARAILRPIEVT